MKGIGHPEPLSGNYSGWYSRHIDDKNRLIYRVVPHTIEILACKGHYTDK
jgi:toxin YoeB